MLVFWHFVIFKTLIRTFLSSLSCFLSSALAPLLTFFSPLSQLFIPSSRASFNFPSLSFLSRVVFSYSFPLPLPYLPSLSSCFVCTPLFFSLSVCYLLVSGWVDFFWGFFFFLRSRRKRLRHLKPSTPSFSPLVLALFSSFNPSLVFHFPHLFPVPILILLCLLWPNFSLVFFFFLIHLSVGPAEKMAEQSVCNCVLLWTSSVVTSE